MFTKKIKTTLTALFQSQIISNIGPEIENVASFKLVMQISESIQVSTKINKPWTISYWLDSTTQAVEY